MQTMTIARRFRGPPNSGNGGYVCGMLAHATFPVPRKSLCARRHRWRRRFPGEKARAADMIMAWVSEGKLHPRVDRVLPLEQATDAMTAIAERSVQGRIVLRVK
jgi:NADPH:quinone reductase-like Zn-dependent oxidoreductase